MSATTTDGNYIKKVLPVHSQTANKRKRRRRRKIAIAKLFAFHAGLKPGCGQN